MPAWMPIIGGAATLAGSLLGRSERPTIDPEQLRMLFGPQAIGAESNELFNLLRNSPVFAQIMSGMAAQGTALGNQVQRRVAMSGAGGSPIGAFASAAARGYGGAMQRGALADLFMKAFTAANANVAGRRDIWAQSQLGRQQDPTFNRMLGTAFLNTGASAFGKWFDKL